jgi:hypothetical protein
MMDIIDHGDWVSYRPESHPLLRHNVLFCKRVSDGIDWYKFQRQDDFLTSTTVKMTLLKINDEWTVQATQRDGSMIWPLNNKLIELNIDGDHEVYRRRRFNIDHREFYAPAPTSIMRSDLLIEMHYAGLLESWQKQVQDSDVVTQLSLGAERPMTEDDAQIKVVANKLSWNREQLKKLFDDARKRIGS